MFFFEKKNQKTFMSSAKALSDSTGTQERKSVLALLFKTDQNFLVRI
jgi:hypothetical protein